MLQNLTFFGYGLEAKLSLDKPGGLLKFVDETLPYSPDWFPRENAPQGPVTRSRGKSFERRGYSPWAFTKILRIRLSSPLPTQFVDSRPLCCLVRHMRQFSSLPQPSPPTDGAHASLGSC